MKEVRFTFRHNNLPKMSMTVQADSIRAAFNQALDALGDERVDDLDSVDVITEDQLDSQMILEFGEGENG